MAITKAVSANAQKNRGGTVVFGGVTSNSATNVPGLSLIGYSGNRGVNSKSPSSSLQISQGLGYTSKAISAGDYSIMTKSRYVVMLYTNFLAGIASSILNGGSADFNRRSINYSVRARTSFLLTYSWTADNEAKGVTYTATYSNQNTIFADDQAGLPTRAIPGEFTYLISMNTPTNEDYPAKT